MPPCLAWAGTRWIWGVPLLVGAGFSPQRGSVPSFGGVSAGGGGWGAPRLCLPPCPRCRDKAGGDRSPKVGAPQHLAQLWCTPVGLCTPGAHQWGLAWPPPATPDPLVSPNQPLLSWPIPPRGSHPQRRGWGSVQKPHSLQLGEDAGGWGDTGTPSAAPHVWGSPMVGGLPASTGETRSTQAALEEKSTQTPFIGEPGAASASGKSLPASVSAPRRAPSGTTVLPPSPPPPSSSSSSPPPESSLTAPSCRPFCRRRPR